MFKQLDWKWFFIGTLGWMISTPIGFYFAVVSTGPLVPPLPVPIFAGFAGGIWVFSVLLPFFFGGERER